MKNILFVVSLTEKSTKLINMINNYDLVVTRESSGATIFQRMKTTSYSFNNRNWFSIVVTFLMLLSFVFVQAQSSANYTFTTGTSALNSMTGATTLVTGNNDDWGSTVLPIGFNFIYMGTYYSHFSVNSNGQLRLHTSAGATAIGSSNVSSYSASSVTIAPMAGDNETGNGMSYLVSGTAPNRKLIIEWNNFYAYYTDMTTSGNMQLILNEGTGVIDFLYGSIYNSQSAVTTRSIFHSSSNTANSSAFITVGTTPTQNTTATSPTVNSFAASVQIANLANTFYKFTPPVPASGPTGLALSSATSTSMILNWAAASSTTNVVRYVVFNSINGGVTYNFVANVALGTNTYNATGLTPGTTYDWKVVAISEGVESVPATGTLATTAATTYYWVGTTGGNWNTASNWNTVADGTGTTRGTVATTDILIVDGDGTTPGGTTTINVDLASFTIGQFKVTSNTNVTLQSNATTTRTITISGSPGDDFVVDSGSILNLNHAANPIAFAFSGTGNTGLIAGTINLAGSTSNTITTTGGTSTLVTVASTGIVNLGSTGNSLVGSAATLSFLAGSNCNSTGATTGAPPVPLATWDTNSTLTIIGLTSSTTAATNNNQSFGNIVFNCPLLTATYNFFGSNSVTVKGNLTITAAGATGGTGIFRATSTGTITVNGNILITQGRFQAGTTGTVIANANTTIATNGILDTASSTGVFSQRGANLTNNGVLTGTTGTLQFLNLTGSFAQTFAGSGTVLTNLATLSVQNTAGLTITHANPVIIARANLFQGIITGSNKITFGTGLAVPCTTQIGSAGLVTPGGSFDQAPIFNLGTGTYALIYAQESVSRTVGFEVPPSRLVSSISLTNSNGLVVAGGNLGTGTLTFGTGSGNITTNTSNVLTVTGTTTGSIVRTSTTAYVNGPLEITLPASLATGSTYVLPIGKSSLNPFELVSPTTAATGTVVVRSEVFDGATGGTNGILIGALNTNRYWATSITNGSANFTNSLIKLNDTPNGADAIGRSATLTGAYDMIGGLTTTATASSLQSTNPAVTTLDGYYVMASKASATLATPTITPSGNQCTNVSRAISVLVTPGGGSITSVVLNYSLNGVAQTAINMTNSTNNGGLSADTWIATIPTVTPTNANVTWSIVATDSNGLTKNIVGTPYKDEPTNGLTASANASSTTICAGNPTVLNMDLVGSGNVTIGTGTGLTPGSSGGTDDVTAFNNYRSSYKMQTIYTAAELYSAGLRAGNITSIAYNISSNGSSTTNSAFVVKIGTTSLSTLTDFVVSTGFTTVFPSATYTHAVGWNTINFSTPFNWDGTSNIVIEVTHSGSNSSYSAETYFTPTTGNTVATSYNGGTTGTPSVKRLNIRFGGQASQAANSYSWSNGISVVGTTNPLTVNPTVTTTYTGTALIGGCPVTATTTVTVNPLPTAPTATNSAQCGTQVPTASVADTNGFITPTFKWYGAATGGTALQSSTSTTYTTAVSTTTTFYVSVVNPTTNCESVRTPITVTVSTPDLISATTTTSTICLGQSAVLNATNTSTTPFQNYTYSWLSTTGSGLVVSQSGASITVTPTAVGTYTYTVTAVDGGCQTTNTVVVTVNPLPAITTATASPNVACAGSTINLDATVINIQAGTANLGAGASTSSSAGQSFLPGSWGGAKTQYLIRASELTALGYSAGNITSLAFEPTTSGQTYTGFQLWVDQTVSTNLTTTFLPAGTQVYLATGANNAFTPVANTVNTLAFGTGAGSATSFNWDGTSNLVVTFSWSSVPSATTSTSSTMKVDAPGFTCTTYNQSDSLTPAAMFATTSGSTGTNRPKFILGGQIATNVTSSYNWTWKIGTTTVLNTASGTTTVPTGATTTYTVTATNIATGCSASQNVTVSTNVAPLSMFAIAPQSSSICVGETVTLYANPTGGCIPYTYSWSDGTSVVGTASSLAVSPTSDKTYTLTITDNAGTQLVKTATVSVNNPQPISVLGQTICASSAAFTLSATESVSGNLLNWYATQTGGNILASGNTFTTPTLSTSTTYYVEENALGVASTGLGRAATTATASTTPSTYGLVFNLNVKTKLNSVDVYLASTTAGNLVIELQNSAGTVINSKTIAVPAGNATTPVQYTLPLDFIIPAGTGYRLLAISGTSMVRESSLGGFPYSLSYFGDITGGYISGASTSYYFFYNWSLSDICTGLRVPVTATLNTPPMITLSGTSATICSGQSTSTAVTVATGGSNYNTYTWSPSVGVTGNSSTGWTFNPTSTTTYTLTASQSSGTCSTTATYLVNVNSTPSAITIAPTVPAVCVNSIQSLTVTGGTIGSVVNVGTSNNTNSTTGYPSPFTNYYGGTKHQMLIRASELTALGLSPNIPIQSLSFEVTAVGSTFTGTLQNFQVDMASTNATVLTSTAFLPVTTNVRAASDLPIAVGVVTIPLNGNFAWDGVSNIVIQTSYSNANSGTTNDFVQIKNSDPGFISTNWYRTDSSTAASVLAATTPSSSGNARPNMILDNLASTSITWSPTTNLYTDAAATIPYTGGNATTLYVKSSSV
ncbi:fibronectin type III domain-containing protein, partial [Flavobacterium sp.]|uniref:beta strand repeat-containing protein n=1 Tax=Flavobacterium sp. TaxID=239 RepID=UPI0025BB1C74